MSVAWTKNGDNEYLVESKEHLLQIMNKGALYTDAGDAPTDYWASSYLQTSDIDLKDDHASIVPIGNETAQFTGEYDGARFQIMNWSYVVEELTHAGLFGYCGGGTVLRHIRLSGTWTLAPCLYSGFAAGYLVSSTMYDVAGDFAVGTSLNGNGTGWNSGTMIGRALSSSLHGVSVGGTVEFGSSTDGYTSGLIGFVTGGTSVNMCRNIASFPNGITGNICGGIIAYADNGTLDSCLNGMTGDIVATTEAGGIIGRTDNAVQMDSVVNSMTGDLNAQQRSGGIIAMVYLYDNKWLSASKLLNYMKGDIVGPDDAGGLVGTLHTTADVVDTVVTNSVVAMQGSVANAVVSAATGFTPSEVEVSVDTSFGMTFTTDAYGSATMVVDDALVYHPQFTDLPYVDMSGTDPDGNVYDWDFVFANIGGKFDHYTHLSVHTAEVSAPFHTDFGLGESNSVVYLTYANVDEKSLYTDSSLSISDTTAEIAFDYAKSVIVYGTPDPSETVVWTKSADGRFEVATKQHLLQLMSAGTRYTDLGDHPKEYWSSSYVETADIDLVDDHASITPIGNDTTRFTGEYDGARFQIMNWSYSGTETFTGLFGCCWEGCVLKHIRLSGAWSLLRNSLNTRSGFLVGYLYKISVDDVEANFDAGTVIQGNSSVGVLIGRSDHSLCHKLTLRGTVDSVEGTDDVGGLVGHLSGDLSDFEHCRNLATFPTGIISGDYAGGIMGTCMKSAFSKCLNAMQGDLSASNGAGGICGHFNLASMNDAVVNSMVGNVTGTNFAGGIFGKVTVTERYPLSGTRILNYMKGDVVGPSGAGGIMGTCIDSGSVPGDIEITKSVVAMQGNVTQSVRGTENFTPSVIEVTVDTSFGMAYTSNDYGSATMVVDDSLVYHPQFTDLPYIDMSGTDADGFLYAWDFVFGNVGGKYPEYTHLSAHTGVVSAPYLTDFGLGESNTVVYLTYANTDTNTLFHSASLAIVETAAATVTILAGPPVKGDFFFAEENVYDITEAGADVAAAVNGLFATGDRVAVTVNSAPTKTTFVNRGGQIDIAGANAILLPFDPAVADGQDATFTLSDATSVDVGFDQASGNIVVDGTTYSHGDYFVMDGQKVSVFDI